MYVNKKVFIMMRIIRNFTFIINNSQINTSYYILFAFQKFDNLILIKIFVCDFFSEIFHNLRDWWKFSSIQFINIAY
jgi:hypothetical protein